MPAARHETVDEYIGSFPPDVRRVLQDLRRTIRTAAPSAAEAITYQMPTMTLDGRKLVHYAAWKNHISVYPVPVGDEAFDRDIAPYRAAKGTARFPLGAPLPHELIGRLVVLLAEQRAV